MTLPTTEPQPETADDPEAPGRRERRERRARRRRRLVRLTIGLVATALLAGGYVAFDHHVADDAVATAAERDRDGRTEVPDGIVGVSAAPADGPPTEIDNRVFVVGDSVFEAAAVHLPDTMPDWAVTSDTRVGRFTAEGIRVVQRYREEEDVIGRIAVVGLGNNYGGDAEAFAREIDEMMFSLGGVDHVIWFQVAEYRTVQEEVNEQLRLAAERYPHLVLVDWNAWYESEPDFTGADRLHLTPEGAVAMANLIADSVTAVTRAANEVPGESDHETEIVTKSTMGTSRRRTRSSSDNSTTRSTTKATNRSSSRSSASRSTTSAAPRPPTTQSSAGGSATTEPPRTSPTTPTSPTAPAAPPDSTPATTTPTP